MKVGLSGNIGSGKSTIAKIFKQLHIPVFFADQIAKNSYFNSGIAEQIIALIGSQAYYSPTEINKEYISNKIFQHKELLMGINAIIHPYVHKEWNLFCDNHQESPYVIMEAAIIHESGSYKNFDKIILVTAPEAMRISRVISREKCSIKEVKERINRQWLESKKIDLSDFIIQNDQHISVIQQVLAIHKTLSFPLS